MGGLHSVKLTSNWVKQSEIQPLEIRVIMAKFSLVTTKPYKFMMNEQPDAEWFAVAAAWRSFLLGWTNQTGYPQIKRK